MHSNIDFLIVGAGLYGATIARLLTDAGFSQDQINEFVSMYNEAIEEINARKNIPSKTKKLLISTVLKS